MTFLIISNMFKSITNITLPECLENYDPSKEIESFWNEFSKSLYGWPSALENYEYAYKFDEQDIDTIIKNIKKSNNLFRSTWLWISRSWLYCQHQSYIERN
ncbi:hypothetical protein B738_19357 [Photorhabdus temperata subsp. temperata M1021]|nr:hypothetical protein B738_19357 [Photorhabdus temperata subsp. temperata M1021]